MALHTDPDGIVDPDAFERETLTRIGMPREIAMRHRLPPVRPFVLVRRLLGRLLFLPLVGDDGCRHRAAFQETGNVRDPATALALSPTPCCRPATRPTAPKPTASSRGRDPDVNALAQKARLPDRRSGLRRRPRRRKRGAAGRLHESLPDGEVGGGEFIGGPGVGESPPPNPPSHRGRATILRCRNGATAARAAPRLRRPPPGPRRGRSPS